MAINDILDEIENLVVDSVHIIFTNKALLNEEELVHLVDELRKELPKELRQAEKIMQEKEMIISNAKDEAERIMEEAKTYANHLVSEEEVVKAASEKAELILSQANAQEEEIMTRTVNQSESLKQNADQYANQILDDLISNVDSITTILHEAKMSLNQSNTNEN